MVEVDVDPDEMTDFNPASIVTKEIADALQEVEHWKQWLHPSHDADEIWVNKMACDKFDKDCTICRKAKGGKRPHWRGAMKDMRLTLCADLTGPHPEEPCLNFRYLLVVVAVDKDGRRLPFCRGLRSKRGNEVSNSLESVVKEIRAMDPSVEFVRFPLKEGFIGVNFRRKIYKEFYHNIND